MNKVTFLYLNQEDILSLNIGFDEILSVTEKALKEHARKAFEMPTKPGIHPLPGAFIHAMPAYLPKLGAAGLKWVSGFPENGKKGLPMIIGLLILNDPETGLPLCMMDATWVTAIRTAAVSAIAAKYLMRTDSRALGIIGAGTQGTYHAEMFKQILPSIQEVFVFDISHGQLERFRSHLQSINGLTVKIAPSPKAVFEESDMVITATGKQDAPLVENFWLKKGGFYIGIESFRYWSEGALLSADKFVTDDWAQTQSFLRNTKHIANPPQLYAELGEIVSGEKSGRETEYEQIVCIFVGMGLVDIAFGHMVFTMAVEKGIGDELTLGRF